MKHCSKCGAQLNDDAMFCKKCGHKQFDDTSEVEERTEEPVEYKNENSRTESPKPVDTKTEVTAEKNIKTDGKIIEKEVVDENAEDAIHVEESKSEEVGVSHKTFSIEDCNSSSKKKTITVMIIIVAVVLIGVIAIFLVKSGIESNKNKPSNGISMESQVETESLTSSELKPIDKAATEVTDEKKVETADNGEEPMAVVETDAKKVDIEDVLAVEFSSKPAVRIELSEYKDATENINGQEVRTGYTTSFIGIDEDGRKVWEIPSGFQHYTELDLTVVLGVNNGYGYIYCNGVKKIDLNDGSVVWSANVCSGSPSWDFDKDGNLYVIGYYDFYLSKVDNSGNVITSPETMYYYWPYKVETKGDTVSVTYEMPKTTIIDYRTADLTPTTENFFNNGVETEATIETSPAVYNREFTKDEAASMAQSLGVPLDRPVQCKFGKPYYKDSWECMLVYAEFFIDGECVASGTFDAETLELLCDMWFYGEEY